MQRAYSPFLKYRYRVGICLLICLCTFCSCLSNCAYLINTYIDLKTYASPHFCIRCVPGLIRHLFCVTSLLCAHIVALLAQKRLGEDRGGVLPHPPERGDTPQPTTFASPCFSKVEELGVMGGRSEGD